MRNEIRVPATAWAEIHLHLLKNAVEQVAVVFAKPILASEAVAFEYEQHALLTPEDFDHQSTYHIALSDVAQRSMIKTAWDSGTSIVELHSHRGRYAEARFSPSDLAGFDEFVPHVWWRLRGKPYAAVVLTDTGFDCLVWRFDPRRPEPVRALVLGTNERTPTNQTILSLPRTDAGRPLR